MPNSTSGFARALAALTDAGVSYLVVGVGGINFYALHDAEGEIDLLLSISGSSFSDLAADATVFRVTNSEVRVGSLEKLLRAKEASGCPKDLEFLRAFAARADEDRGS